MPREPQLDLFTGIYCPCGTRLVECPQQACCRRCYWRLQHSRRHYAGQREAVLSRDRHRCRVCGSRKTLHIHHRVPGVNDRRRLITLCAACHSQVHHLAHLRNWVPRVLRRLWAETHPELPLQLPLFQAERLIN